MIMKRTCRQCGKEFQGGPRAWYCPGCRVEKQREYERKYNRTSSRKIGSTDLCVVCGGEYTVESGTQKYCPACRVEAVKAVDRRQGLEYYAANKSNINPSRYEKRRKPKFIQCARCGKTIEHNSTRLKYCDDCKPVVVKEQMREAEKRRKPRTGEGKK